MKNSFLDVPWFLDVLWYQGCGHRNTDIRLDSYHRCFHNRKVGLDIDHFLLFYFVSMKWLGHKTCRGVGQWVKILSSDLTDATLMIEVPPDVYLYLCICICVLIYCVFVFAQWLSRYQAICHPLSLSSRTGVGRSKRLSEKGFQCDPVPARMVVIVWAISLISSLPWAIFTKVKSTSIKCVMKSEENWSFCLKHLKFNLNK